MYKFQEQLAIGEENEMKLDSFLAKWFDIDRVSQEGQRQGIDRLFTRRDNKVTYRVEYKTDFTASRTGNAFIETVSVDTQQKPGWALHSQADFLIYFLPLDGLIYAIRMPQLRAQLVSWKARYPLRSIPNKGYSTIGLLVPLRELERLAVQVLCL